MDFLEGPQAKDEPWARELVVKIGKLVEDQPMEAWAYTVNENKSPAITDSLDRGKLVTLDRPCRDPRDCDEIAIPASGCVMGLPSGQLPSRLSAPGKWSQL